LKKAAKENRSLIPRRGRQDHQAGNHTTAKDFNLPDLVSDCQRYVTEDMHESGVAWVPDFWPVPTEVGIFDGG
jgi:hypothetical protein